MPPSLIDLINVNNNCAPGVKPRKIGNNESCMSTSQLKILAKELGLSTNGSDDEIFSRIDDKLASCNGSDFCWTEKIKSSAIDTIRRESFKPKKPVGERQWLSNFDIEDVMVQYEKLYDNFTFYGPVSSDVYKPNLKASFNIPNDYKNFIYGNKPRNPISPNKRKNLIAITFNTDPHTKGGEHWVTLVIKISGTKRGSMEAIFMYFDSVGKYPNDNISKSIMQLIEMFDNSGDYKLIELLVNRVQHQKKNSECGVYSLNFILKCLNGEEFIDIINDVNPDDEMQKTRGLILFAE
jgi:hypothetical protein